MPKVRSSSSPLGNPKTPLHRLAAEFQNHVYFPDPAPLYVTLGSIAANMMDGDPVWLMLVGPAACGKTMLLSSTLEIPRVVPASSIKGPGAFLSGTSRKDAKGGTGGLLFEIGTRGLLLVKDFQSILTLEAAARKETIGAFRDIADGWWDRPVGSDGGRTLKWRGRIGFLGACVPAVDAYGHVLSDLGERWVYWRYPYTLKDLRRGWGESNRKLKNRDREGTQNAIKDLVHGFFEEMGFGWGCMDGCKVAHSHVEGPEKRELKQAEINRIYAMGIVASAARSPVARDGYGNRDVVDVPSHEEPTRINGMLAQLYLGLEAIGLEVAERWKLVAKVALDSVPALRMHVLREVMAGRGTVREIADQTPVGVKAVARTMKDLEIHGVLEVGGKGQGSDNGVGGGYRVSKEFKEEWKKGFGRA